MLKQLVKKVWECKKTKDRFLRIIATGNFIIEFIPDFPSKEVPFLGQS